MLKYLFLTEFMKNIKLLKTEMEGHETALCCHTCTHIYLSNRTLQIHIISYNAAQMVSYFCWVIIQVSLTRKYIYYHLSQPVLLVNCSVF